MKMSFLKNLPKIARSLDSLSTQIYPRMYSSIGQESFEKYFQEHHIPINNFQKILLSIGSALTAISNPYRADMVATLGETTGNSALEYMLSRMQSSEEGSRILLEKPRLNTITVDLDQLRNLPNTTLGRIYVNFLDENKVTPDSRDPVRFIEDVELAYVMQRYREIHDFAHAILGMNISILGEITIKWFEAVHFKLPMCFYGALFGPLKLESTERKQLLTHYLPWATENGRNSNFLLNSYFEKRLEQPIDDLRRELNIKTLVLPKQSI